MIIQRYDEVMTNKVDKTTFYTLENYADENFVKHNKLENILNDYKNQVVAGQKTKFDEMSAYFDTSF